jgi:hypothetical protein
MRHRKLIAVGFLDGAAVVAALFFGLQSHSTHTPTAPRTAVAQATPSSGAAAQVLAEDARARQARQAEAKTSRLREATARETHQLQVRASRLRERHAREARRVGLRAQKAAAREAGRTPAHTGGPGATAQKPEHEARAKKERQTKDSKPKHKESSREQAESKHQRNRERAEEAREVKRAEREAARSKTDEERRSREALPAAQ